MTETIALDVSLRAYVRRETTRRWIATCPMIGVVSQGPTLEKAKAAIQEAVELWFESCIERGVLEQALREANFRPSRAAATGAIDADPPRERRSTVLGEQFDVHLTIPGYEAATLLSASA